jgi:hypothetical protein
MAKFMPKRLKLTLPIDPPAAAGNERILNLVSCQGGGQYRGDLGDALQLTPKGIAITLHDFGVADGRLFDFWGKITIEGAE